jgi:hypothetical protein
MGTEYAVVWGVVYMYMLQYESMNGMCLLKVSYLGKIGWK